MKKLSLLLILIYRGLSPSFHFLTQVFGLPCQCKFPVSCSEFALHQLKTNSSLLDSWKKILTRLWICSPWGAIFHSMKSKENF